MLQNTQKISEQNASANFDIFAEPYPEIKWPEATLPKISAGLVGTTELDSVAILAGEDLESALGSDRQSTAIAPSALSDKLHRGLIGAAVGALTFSTLQTLPALSTSGFSLIQALQTFGPIIAAGVTYVVCGSLKKD